MPCLESKTLAERQWRRLPAKLRWRYALSRLAPEHRPVVQLLVCLSAAGDARARRLLSRFFQARAPGALDGGGKEC